MEDIMTNKEMLKKLTIDEKIKLTTGSDLWHFLGNERLGIESFLVADGPHGVRVYKENVEIEDALDQNILAESTMFPCASAMASTFNLDMIQKVGKTIGDECNMYNVDILLGPGVNLKRSPLGGRNFEYYSEDPFLSGKMGTSFINGVQSTGVSACIKHFALNEQETLRRFNNSVVDQRTMHELYLLPFEMAIKNANPKTVMTSYNRVNGHYTCESKELLLDVLRDKWNYKGAVMSDWGAVQDKPKSIRDGLNLEMNGPSELEDFVYEALQNGELTEEDIDNSLLPLFWLRDEILKNKNKGKKTSLKDNHNFASKVSEEAIVLLENDGVLPLNKNIKIGVIGDFAVNPRITGGGSATLKPLIIEKPLDELKAVFEVEYAKGYVEENTSTELLKEVFEVSSNNDVVIYFTGTTTSLESEGRERPHMGLPLGHIEVFNEIKKTNAKVIVVLNNGSAIDLTGISRHVNAIVEAWLLGGANAKGLVKIITGDVNPSGRLAETFPLCIENTPHYSNYPSIQDDVLYHGDIVNMGYRYYDTHKFPVRFPFGYGLSYTKFEYSNLQLDKTNLTDGDSLDITVTVTNIGNRSGSEVVQVYVNDIESFYQRPLKELKGFAKVNLEPGESKDVIIRLDSRAFSFYSVDFEDFRVESGEFQIMVGSNVRDIHLSKSVNYKTGIPFIAKPRMDHPVNYHLTHNPELIKYLEDRFGKIEWYDKEQPIERMIRRFKRDHKLSDEEYKFILNKI